MKTLAITTLIITALANTALAQAAANESPTVALAMSSMTATSWIAPAKSSAEKRASRQDIESNSAATVADVSARLNAQLEEKMALKLNASER